MPCLQTLTGIPKECSNNIGGIEVIYIANREDVTSVTASAGVVTAITMASSKKFKAYHMKRETGSFTQTLQTPQMGTAYWVNEAVGVFPKMDATKRAEMLALAIGELVAIVKDNNGVYWYLGHDFPVRVTAGTGQTGTAFGDANNYSVTLNDTSLEPALTADEEAVEAVID